MCDEAFVVKEKYTVSDVAKLVRLLRDPQKGCPWDKEQTHESIRKNFLEEAYEACDAIDKKDTVHLREELGDVLLQVALHSEIERETGTFDMDDVADELCKKLVMRHPHIFGDVSLENSKDVLDKWEEIKRRQKGQKAGSAPIDDVPDAFPALYKCQKVQKRAKDAGFDYNNVGEALNDLKSEVNELERAVGSSLNIEEEVGDVIFAAVNVARLTDFDAEYAAVRACDKFKARFKKVEELAAADGHSINQCDFELQNEYWIQAKILLNTEGHN